jgi:hypothetical protein
MVNLSRQSILEKFPCAKEKLLFDKIDKEHDFDSSIQWNLNQQHTACCVAI